MDRRHPSGPKVPTGHPRLCGMCRGSGQDALTPQRTTGTGRSVLFLVRPCPDCDGHGVVPLAQDRDLNRQLVGTGF